MAWRGKNDTKIIGTRIGHICHIKKRLGLAVCVSVVSCVQSLFLGWALVAQWNFIYNFVSKINSKLSIRLFSKSLNKIRTFFLVCGLDMPKIVQIPDF